MPDGVPGTVTSIAGHAFTVATSAGGAAASAASSVIDEQYVWTLQSI